MSITQGEHTFQVDVLVQGDVLRGYTAASDLTAGEPVQVSGENTVDSAGTGEHAIGAAAYDVAAGEEVAVCASDTVIRVDGVAADVAAQEMVTPDGAGGYQAATESDAELAVALTAGGGDSTDLFITTPSGTIRA